MRPLDSNAVAVDRLVDPRAIDYIEASAIGHLCFPASMSGKELAARQRAGRNPGSVRSEAL
jgi:hypothetical protein